MANDITGHKDIVMALSWNLAANVTYAILLGCEETDLKSCWNFLSYSTQAIGHPLLLLALFADLQLKRLKKLHRAELINLYIATSEAGLTRTEGPEVFATIQVPPGAQPSIDFDKVTRDVLRNFQDSGHLFQAMGRVRSQVQKVAACIDVSEPALSLEMKAYLSLNGGRISKQLETIISRYDNLIERSRLTTDGSSLLMSALWNLIAQKDNKINQAIAIESKRIAEDSTNIARESKGLAESSASLAADSKEIAEDSKQIAEATRRDSTSMKAIAMLTMVFLPATFAAVRESFYFHPKYQDSV